VISIYESFSCNFKEKLKPKSSTYQFVLSSILTFGDLGCTFLVEVGQFNLLLELFEFFAFLADLFYFSFLLFVVYFEASHFFG
jgi:hypothetical protein